LFIAVSFTRLVELRIQPVNPADINIYFTFRFILRRFRVRSLIGAFNGSFGKIVAGLIAESQSEPGVLQEFFDRWVSPRRTATIADLQRGRNAGELRSEAEPELA
jgi:hypothetical protein